MLVIKRYLTALMALCLAASAEGVVTFRIPMSLDRSSSPRTPKATESIRYSSAWETDGVTAKVCVNGIAVTNATGAGAYSWSPTENGIYTLTHTVLDSASAQIGSELSATFNVLDMGWPVTFDANGPSATGMPTTLYVPHDSMLTAPTSDPSASGYRFTGWYTTAACTTAFDFANTTITAATTIYAGWVKMYELKLTKGTGISKITVTAGSLTLSNQGITLTLEAGTSVSISATVQKGYNAYAKETFTMSSDVTKTISATPKTYTVSFNANGKDATMPPSQTVMHSFQAEMPTDTPSATGYRFTGWYTTADCTTAFDFANTEITAATTIYAGWVKTYVLTLMEGEGIATIYVKVGSESRTTYSTALTLDAGTSVAISVDVQTGYYTYPDETVTMSEDVTKMISTTLKTYTVTFNANGKDATMPPSQTVSHDSKVTAPTDTPSATGYRFTGWYTTAECTTAFDFANTTIAAATTIYAGWVKVCELKLMRGAGISKITVTAGSLKLSKSGTVQASLDEGTSVSISATVQNGYNAYAKETFTMSSDVTKTISATPISYALSCDLADGSLATANPTSYTIESDDIKLNNPTKEGYTFAGWTGTDLTVASPSVTIVKGSTGNRTYAATWTINSYDFTVSGGSNAVVTVTTNGYEFAYVAGLKFPHNTAWSVKATAKAGYEFAAQAVTNANGTVNAANVSVTLGDACLRSEPDPSQPSALIGSAGLAGGTDSVKVIASEMSPSEGCVELTVQLTLKDGIDFASWAEQTREKKLFQVEAGETLASMSPVNGEMTFVRSDEEYATVTLRAELPKGTSGFFRAVVGNCE